MRERLEFYLRDARGFAYDVVNAVLAAGSDDVVDAIARAEAVAKVRGLPDFESVAAAFKRINNIIKQARDKGIAAALKSSSIFQIVRMKRSYWRGERNCSHLDSSRRTWRRTTPTR